MDEAIRVFASALLFFWAIVLVSISMATEEQRIFWTQRVIAFCVLVAGVSIWTLT